MDDEKIIRCICVREDADAISRNSAAGMPVLKMHQLGEWSALCPDCKRGMLFHFPTPFEALKEWNAMQRRIKTFGELQAKREAVLAARKHVMYYRENET